MTWKPERAVQLVAGTPPGGGLDRVARALEKAIAAAKLFDVPVEVLNVPYWAGILEAATKTSVRRDELARLSWSPLVQTGAALNS